MINHSPWLDFKRTEWPILKTDLTCDVAIVGGGISGVATLYYLLTLTQNKVVLVEKSRVASGATGHNAGLAVAFIEKPASELVSLIGEEATLALYNELNQAWDDLEAIHEAIDLKDNLLSFPYFANGFNSLPQFISYLRDVLIRENDVEGAWRFYVDERLSEEMPEDLAAEVEFVPHQTILAALRSIDTSYIAAGMRISTFRAKRMNSAKFCYKVLDYLKEKFGDRFSVYEHTDIANIDLYEDSATLTHAQGTITSQDVILCTNAYKNFSIRDQVRNKAVTKLQDSITPRIGFLIAFSPSSLERYALGFLNHTGDYKDVPFWYFSQAPHAAHNPNHACVLGGPEFNLDDSYSPEWIESKGEKSLAMIHYFLKTTFKDAPQTFPFYWHGWMGYTSNGLRWVGPDADYPHLWYNLACNGIGIVPAIGGAKRIATLMAP